MYGRNSHLSNLFDGQCHDIHKQIDLFFIEPASLQFPLLQITKQVPLVAILRHEDGFLPKPIHGFHLDHKFRLSFGVVLLNSFEFLKVRFNFARLGLKHFDFGSINSHHSLLLNVQSHIRRLLIVVFILVKCFRRAIEQILFYEGFGQ